MSSTSLLLLLASLSSLQGLSLRGNHSSQVRNRVARVLAEYPVIDGHNDFPMGIRSLLRNDISKLEFQQDLTKVEPWASWWANHVDLPRYRILSVQVQVKILVQVSLPCPPPG